MERTQKLLHGAMLAVLCGILALTLYTAWENETTRTALLIAVPVVGALLLAKRYLPKLPVRLSERSALLWLTVLCVAVKTAWVLLVRVQPKGDYYTFFNFARQLSQSWQVESRYVALFPHIFGYSSFLSAFFVFLPSGAELPAAIALNVILSTLSGILLFQIGKQLWGWQAGGVVFLLWVLCPSQTMWNSMVLSEPLCTTLILLFLCVLVRYSAENAPAGGGGIPPLSRSLLCGVLCGLLLRWVNLCRPIAAIFVIALVIWLFILNAVSLRDSAYRKKWLPLMVGLCVSYFVTAPLCDALLASRLGEEAASLPGYNIYVGFNAKTLGKWNKADSDLLFSYSEKGTAQWAQRQMLEEAKARITAGNYSFAVLFKGKLNNFLGQDASCVSPVAGCLTDRDTAELVCNTFYYGLLLLTLIDTVRAYRQDRTNAMTVGSLYLIGLTLAQMLVEVAGRYHYSMIPFFVLHSAALLSAVPKKQHTLQ